MMNNRMRLFKKWSFHVLTCAGVALTLTPSAHANSLYWRRFNPSHIGPGPVFISPAGNIWNGGWWMSVDLGRTPLSICRVSDGPFWAYGNYFDGNCTYYSPSINRGNRISVGFDLMGGTNFPNWRPLPGGPIHPYNFGDQPSDTSVNQAAAQQQSVLDDELTSLCRVQQADGAFIGTLREGSCYAAWDGQTIISADYETVESSDQR